MAIEASSALIDFFDPAVRGFDKRGRTLSSILDFDDDELEAIHDYIQTVFPMPEERGIGLAAVDEKVFDAFRSRSELRQELRGAFERMLEFYGFEMKRHPSGLDIQMAANYQERFSNWLKRWNHNHLRITRIIRSLRVLGLEEEAQAFFDALAKVHWKSHRKIIDSTTWAYWERAAVRPLYADPAQAAERRGKSFLRQFEEKRALGGHHDAEDGES